MTTWAEAMVPIFTPDLPSVPIKILTSWSSSLRRGPYDAPEQQAYAAPPSLPPDPPVEAKPGEPTVLVFRDGHQQEVTNYAIMGDTVYVFDKGHKKIALADLDVPATVKANDDRGLEFKVPAPPAQKKNSTCSANHYSGPAHHRSCQHRLGNAVSCFYLSQFLSKDRSGRRAGAFELGCFFMWIRLQMQVFEAQTPASNPGLLML